LSLEQVHQKTGFTVTLLVGSEFNTCVTQRQELLCRIPSVTDGWLLRTTSITTCLWTPWVLAGHSVSEAVTNDICQIS